MNRLSRPSASESAHLRRTTMPDEVATNSSETNAHEEDLLKEAEPEKPLTPLEQLFRKFRKAFHASRPASPATRKELGKDKSKTLFVLVAAAIGVLLFFLAIFSSPQKAKQQQVWQHRGQPDLGRRMTPGQAQQQAGSVTPLLNAQVQNQAALANGQVTPEDIRRTSQPTFGSQPAAPNVTANTLIAPPMNTTANGQSGSTPAPVPGTDHGSSQQYALGKINFPDAALQKEYSQAGYTPNYAAPNAHNGATTSSTTDDDLKKPSLVFVRNEKTARSLPRNLIPTGDSVSTPVALSLAQPSLDSILPPGTRLVARLESPASTAVAGPVVAAIEYNYEQDGQIVVPAGSKAIGKLEQANPSGYVSLHFTRMDFPDGTSERIDGISMGLNYGPVKGLVNGRKRGTRFLVQTLTGLGTMASYLVGAGNFSGPLSESGLLRERIADNVGIAGQNELNQLSFNQNIVVTVPGHTRFYILLQKREDVSGRTSTARRESDSVSSVRNAQSVPNLGELRELFELQREMSQLYPQGASAPSQPRANSGSTIGPNGSSSCQTNPPHSFPPIAGSLEYGCKSTSRELPLSSAFATRKNRGCPRVSLS